jgi:hypothetical protein
MSITVTPEVTPATLSKNDVQQLVKKKPDVDKDNLEIELYCSDYGNNNCVPYSTNAKSYIFVGDNLFLEGYPYSTEIAIPDCERIIEPVLSKCRFFEAHEGTLIRVFNVKDKWYTSTNRRLDAFNSKWAAKTTTFGLHFAAAVQECIRSVDDDDIFEGEEISIEEKKKCSRDYLNKIYEENLDKTKKYMFLLEPCDEERIVCCTKSPNFFNIGVFDKDNNLSLNEEVKLDKFIVPIPKEYVFDNMKDLVDTLEDVNIDEIQGFIVIQSEAGKDDKHFKILNSRYKYLFNLRGNTPSIRFRFIELANNPKTAQTKMIDDFCELYSFDPTDLKNYIWERVVEDLFQKYQNRYIKKIPDFTTTKQDKMLNTIHSHYLRFKSSYSRTDRTRIMNILSIQKPSDLNQLIGEYEKKDKDMKNALVEKV